jgi:mannose-6-phosphate isomerase
MSFMFNPHPFDDPAAVNRLTLGEDITGSIVTGIKESAKYISDLLEEKLIKNPENNVVLALDGYMGAQWEQIINLISQNMLQNSVAVSVVPFAVTYKPGDQLDTELAEYLPLDKEKDPVLLFGKLFKGGFEDLLDNQMLCKVEEDIRRRKIRSHEKRVTIVFGCGCTIRQLRPLYDLICYFDLSPKQVILRARKGVFTNLGDKVAKPVKALLRRCYYVDFEVTGHLRWDLIRNNAIDLYIDSNHPENIRLLPKASFDAILSALATYPMRCKPVYLEGVWGGHYVTKLRNLPGSMRNCAWVFDLIPLEVSIVVEAGKHLLEFPFFTFIQKEGTTVMGTECVEKFGGYFPIRFNYDDTFHSSGNMSIQVHSGESYNRDNFGEHGRQDESYYIVATGHEAKTFVGFNEGADTDEFIAAAKRSENEFTPVDYQKYISHIPSIPGTQVMLPAGTVHSSGRNQVILEIGSLTIGSYTYKLYDYLRADLDGVPRPIHIWHGERVALKERTTGWVKDNLVQEPRLVRKGDQWAEYIVGEHELLYFSLRRLEFEKSVGDDTKGRFHVLTLVDGESVCIQSVDHPERYYVQNYLDVVVVPANMGKYRIKNLGNQPVCVHKTMLKDDFAKDSLPDD